MSVDQLPLHSQTEAVNRAFSRQSVGYDEADSSNLVLQHLRQQVYRHVEKYMKAGSRILELNAGTGIDALHFVSQGHAVHATDISDGMVAQLEHKVIANHLADRLTCQLLSYEQVEQVTGRNFDYVFSNFGGLNCIANLSPVTQPLSMLLKPGGYVTFIIMPHVYVWEWLLILKGRRKQAFRRLQKTGALSHLEGEHFYTYYHSLTKIKRAFGPRFEFIRSEGLAALSPPPHRYDIPLQHPRLYRMLRKVDRYCKDSFPFNRWADHIIVTMRYKAPR